MKKIFLLLAVFIFITNASSCTQVSNKQDLQTSKTEDASNKKQLKVYRMFYDEYISKASVENTFQYPDVEIDEKIYTLDQIDQYKNDVTIELLAGAGPDILICGSGTFKNINKIMQSSILYDLNEFIANDKDFKMSDYYEKIFTCGVNNGKRYLIPLDFRFPAFYTTESVLSKSGVKIDEQWSWKGLHALVKDFIAKNQGKGRYFFESDSFSFIKMVKYSGVNFIDLKEKKSRFDSKEFIELLEIYKDISPSIYQVNQDNMYNSGAEILKNGAAVMVYEDLILSATKLCVVNSIVEQDLNEEPLIYLFPTLEDGVKNTTATAKYMAGINLKCKWKKEAFDFIKVLISKEVQTEGDNNYSLAGDKVNREAFKANILYYSNPTYSERFSSGYSSSIDRYSKYKKIPLPKKLADQAVVMLESIDRCEIDVYVIYNIIEEELPDFLNGKRTADQTAKIINDKVTLVLNE